MVVSSVFLMYAPNVPGSVRVTLSHDYVTLAYCLLQSGNLSQQNVERIVNETRKMLMWMLGLSPAGLNLVHMAKESAAWEAQSMGEDTHDGDAHAKSTHGNAAEDGGGFLVARNMTMPHGFFKGPKPGVLVVTSNLKIGYNEFLNLCMHVGVDAMCQVI
mmetsp:Transcript_11172/g.30832  ORF Transcript_11172/g.30832 Transcript_11172/m.30832 type:complete len:159 (-) Transcript_11172:1232-1708(-)